MSILEKHRFQVKSDLNSLNQVLSQFKLGHQALIPTKDWLQCQLALAEGFTNAVRHAHKGLSSELTIDIELTLLPERLEMRIWDHGSPFDLNSRFKNAHHLPDHDLPGGRGLKILSKIADYLSYDRTEDQRNCLLVVKEFKPTSQVV